jgi:REP element-mobilizing transposase RayT
MIVGHHLLWTAYGCWLPTDPRGSSSKVVRVQEIAELGDHHYGRKQIQPPSHEIREFYQNARTVLKHRLLRFSEEDVAVIAGSFAGTMQRCRYTCYACAIMPDHVHLLIRRHRDTADQMIETLQTDSRAAMIAAGRRPEEHPVWTTGGRKVYQNTREDMERIVLYVENNPLEIGRPAQHWDFVRPYDGWLPPGAR